MKKHKRRIFVGGACRSGTKSTTRMLNKMGIRVDHERMGEDGIVSGFFGFNCPPPMLAHKMPNNWDQHNFLGHYDFDHIIHLVRDPRYAIPSQKAVINKGHVEWWRANNIIGEHQMSPRMRGAAWQWVYINEEMCRLTRKRIHTEEDDVVFHNKFARWLRVRPVDAPEETGRKVMNKASGYRKYEPLTWDQIYALDPDGKLGQRIAKLARRFGYGTP